MLWPLPRNLRDPLRILGKMAGSQPVHYCQPQLMHKINTWEIALALWRYSTSGLWSLDTFALSPRPGGARTNSPAPGIPDPRVAGTPAPSSGRELQWYQTRSPSAIRTYRQTRFIAAAAKMAAYDPEPLITSIYTASA